MSKETSREKRQRKREEERRILAELDAVVAAEKGEEAPKETPSEEKREVLHCRRCRTVMEGGVCPTCGYKTYVPMSEEKRKKVRNILTVVFVGVFVVLFVALKLWK